MSQPTATLVAIVGALSIIWLAVFGALATYNAVAGEDMMDGMWDMMGDMGDMGDMRGMMGGGGNGPQTTGSASGLGAVRITDFSFQPTVLTVTPGTVVTWTNDDSAPHTATGETFDSARLDRGESASAAFSSPGEYAYECVYHPAMKGRIVVSAGS
jgi:plastocyanin